MSRREGDRLVTTLFLAGDVMIGRGIDQVLEHSVDPRLFEPHVSDARTYVRLAEDASGPIPRAVDPSYVWGVALEEIERRAPDERIVNLETAVTTSEQPWPHKDVLYRTHPRNVDVVTAAGIDCCVLANNHVLDWGDRGLDETLRAVTDAGMAPVGAGRDRIEAAAPVILEANGERVIVVGIGSSSAGVPPEWAAGADSPGVNFVSGWSLETASAVAERVGPMRRPGDVVVVSIHWGTNWGYAIPDGQRRLAHTLIDVCGADVVHGHSSHHPRGIEVYRDRLILYGCGDFITDYEGISGYEEFRDDLVLGYFPTLAAGGSLVSLEMAPFRLRRFRLERPTADETAWRAETLSRAGEEFGTSVRRASDGSLTLRWAA